MAKRTEVGKEFLGKLLALIPEDRRSGVAEAFEGAEPALETLGEGVLRQDEFSRGMDALAAKEKEILAYKGELDGWYETNKARLATDPKDGNGNKNKDGLLTRDDVTKLVTDIVGEREKGVASFVSETNRMAIRHFKEFGEELDFNQLYADPEVAKVGLLGVYEKKFGPQLKVKADKAEADRIQKIVDERVAEERKKFSSRPPYPVAGGDRSPLDALEESGENKSPHTVDEAVDHYDKLVQERLNRSGASM